MKKSVLGILLLSLFVVGCGGGDDTGSTAPPAAAPSPMGGGVGAPTGVAGAGGQITKPEDLAKLAKVAGAVLKPTAGSPVTQDSDVSQLTLLAANMGFAARKDPFALLPAEKAFENAQKRELLFEESPSFGTYFEIPEEKPDDSRATARRLETRWGNDR
jgi:hypothetical protein